MEARQNPRGGPDRVELDLVQHLRPPRGMPRVAHAYAPLAGHLQRRGYNMGIRLVDEFLAKAKISRCSSFRDTADVVAKQVRGAGPA